MTKNEAATRQLPVAYGRDANSEARTNSTRYASETRMQAAVVVKRSEDKDPYADVPCTD
ncbi:MAG: hypothetical protein JWP97_5266 [Labilithrix sp.]|nr:hypothetical protein [Labilithrix sp.]